MKFNQTTSSSSISSTVEILNPNMNDCYPFQTDIVIDKSDNKSNENSSDDFDFNCSEDSELSNDNKLGVESHINSIDNDNFSGDLALAFLEAKINYTQGDKILELLKRHRCFNFLPQSTEALFKTSHTPLELIKMEPGDGHLGIKPGTSYPVTINNLIPPVTHHQPTSTPNNNYSASVNTSNDFYQPGQPSSSTIGNHDGNVYNQHHFARSVHDKLDEILRRLINIDERVERMEKTGEENADKDNFFEPPMGFPLKTMDELKKFEYSGAREHNALQSHLEVLGGRSHREALNHYIRTTMTNTLAEQFSWTGKVCTNQAAKASLKKTMLAQIFFRALKKSFPNTKPTRDSFFKDITEVLRSYKQSARNARLSKSRKRAANDSEEKEVFPISDEEI